MNYTTRSFQSFLLPSCSTISGPLATFAHRVHACIALRVSLSRPLRWIALSPDHVNWGRLIIATFREAISIVTVEDLRDRDKLVRWLSRDNLVNHARHSHTFHSTHKYGCYLLIRTRFALYVPTNSISSNLPSLLISPYIHVIRVYTYISLISTFVFPLILPPFIFRWWPFRTGHQNDCTSEKSVTILRKYSLLYTEHNLYIKRNLFRSSFFSSIQKANDLGWF